MWSPTHVQVVVHRARNLTVKGKHGTNDAFVTIQLGKEKFQTSVKEKSENPEWNEECELTIPDGNTSCIVLTALHRNFVGLDKFLGQTQIPLNDLFTSIYERSKNRWYPLESKKGKSNDKKRGELEVRITFTVKSVTGSLMDLSKKPKKVNSLPVKMVQSVGGSLMNLASKDRKHLPFKTLANYGHKLSEKFPKRKSSKNKDEFRDTDSIPSSQDQGSTFDSDDEQYAFGLDPLPDEMPTDYDDRSRTVVEKTNDDFEDDYCMKKESPFAVTETPIRTETISSTISEETKVVTKPPPQERERRRSIPILPQLVESPLENEESAKHKWNKRLRKMKISRSNPRRHTIQGLDLGVDLNGVTNDSKTDTLITPSPTSITARPTPPPRTAPTSATKLIESKKSRSVASEDLKSPVKNKGSETKLRVESSKILSNLPKEKLAMFEKMSKEDLVELIVCQQTSIDRHLKQVRDLEDYIDELLVRVMETTPRLLQNPFKISPSIRKFISSA